MEGIEYGKGYLIRRRVYVCVRIGVRKRARRRGVIIHTRNPIVNYPQVVHNHGIVGLQPLLSYMWIKLWITSAAVHKRIA